MYCVTVWTERSKIRTQPIFAVTIDVIDLNDALAVSSASIESTHFTCMIRFRENTLALSSGIELFEWNARPIEIGPLVVEVLLCGSR